MIFSQLNQRFSFPTAQTTVAVLRFQRLPFGKGVRAGDVPANDLGAPILRADLLGVACSPAPNDLIRTRRTFFGRPLFAHRFASLLASKSGIGGALLAHPSSFALLDLGRLFTCGAHRTLMHISTCGAPSPALRQMRERKQRTAVAAWSRFVVMCEYLRSAAFAPCGVPTWAAAWGCAVLVARATALWAGWWYSGHVSLQSRLNAPGMFQHRPAFVCLHYTTLRCGLPH